MIGDISRYYLDQVSQFQEEQVLQLLKRNNIDIGSILADPAGARRLLKSQGLYLVDEVETIEEGVKKHTLIIAKIIDTQEYTISSKLNIDMGEENHD